MNENRGFTLIELSVVIFILGLFLLVAVPRFKEITEINIKSASRKLSAVIRYLCSEAAFKKRIYRLTFDIDRNEYRVEVIEGNEFVVPRDPMLQKIWKLPKGVYFKDVITQRSLGKTLKGRDDFILFFPTGFVEPAVIHLETENGINYTIATKPYTGGTIVYDRYVEFAR